MSMGNRINGNGKIKRFTYKHTRWNKRMESVGNGRRIKSREVTYITAV